MNKWVPEQPRPWRKFCGVNLVMETPSTGGLTSHVPIIVARIISLLRTPSTECLFQIRFCAKSTLPGAGIMRKHTASPRKRSGNSRRPVSTNFRPERAKDETAEQAQWAYSYRRAFVRASGALQYFYRLGADFSRRLFRGRFVLSFLTPAVELLSAEHVCFRSR